MAASLLPLPSVDSIDLTTTVPGAHRPASLMTGGHAPHGQSKLERSRRQCPPTLQRAVADALAAAASVDDEVAALLTTLPPRTREMLSETWGASAWSPPSLTMLAGRAGISRERVRQLVRRHEGRLQVLAPALPRCARAVRALDMLHGIATSREWADALRAFGLVPAEATPDALGRTLRLIRGLGALGLVPRVAYHRGAGLWMTDAGRAAWRSPTHPRSYFRFAAARLTLGHLVRRHGAVRPEAVAKRLPFPLEVLLPGLFAEPAAAGVRAPDVAAFDVAEDGAQHAYGAAAPQPDGLGIPTTGSMRWLDGYWLAPEGIARPHFDRALETLLAACPELSLQQAAGGLARGVMRNGTQRFSNRPYRLSDTVLATLLADHPLAAVTADGRVVARRPIARTVLSAHARAVLDVLERDGGVARQEVLVQDLARAGYSADMTRELLVRLPFVRRVAWGVYALRSARLSRARLDAVIATRPLHAAPSARAMVVMTDGPDAVVVCYTVTSMLYTGSLTLPGALARRMRECGTAWAVSSGERPCGSATVRKRFLWPIRQAIRAGAHRMGDRVLVTFDLTRRTVRLAPVGAPDATSVEATPHRAD